MRIDWQRIYEWISDNPLLSMCIAIGAIMIIAMIIGNGSDQTYRIVDGSGEPTLSPDVIPVDPKASWQTTDPSYDDVNNTISYKDIINRGNSNGSITLTPEATPTPTPIPVSSPTNGADTTPINGATPIVVSPTPTPTPTPFVTPSPTPEPTEHLTPLAPEDMKKLQDVDIPALTTGLGTIVPHKTSMPQQYYYRGDTVKLHITMYNAQEYDLRNQTIEVTLYRYVMGMWPNIYTMYTQDHLLMPAQKQVVKDYTLQIPSATSINIDGFDFDTAGLYQIRLAIYDTDSRKLITALTFKVNVL